MLEQDEEDINAGRLFKVWLALKGDPHTPIGSVGLSNIVRGRVSKLPSGLPSR